MRLAGYLFKQNNTLASSMTPIIKPKATPSEVTIRIPAQKRSTRKNINKYIIPEIFLKYII